MSSVNVEATEASTAAPTGEERRERLHGTIDALVALRRDVVASYCKLAGIGNFDERENGRFKVDADHLESFCETMVDYTAMGHFEVYQRIIEGKERRRAIKETADDIYPAIAETTDWLVEFNDRHEKVEVSPALRESLTGEVGKLGEIMALRSLLEDQILDALRR